MFKPEELRHSTNVLETVRYVKLKFCFCLQIDVLAKMVKRMLGELVMG